MFRAVLTVAVVLVLAWWCSRLLARQWARGGGGANLEVIEQIQVGQNQRILLLKAGETNYLIGVSQSGVQMLAEVEGEFQAAEPIRPEPLTQLPFRDVLARNLDALVRRRDGLPRHLDSRDNKKGEDK